MPRPTRIGLVFLALLLVLLGGYTAYWLVVAARIKEGAADWARSMQAKKVDASWRQIRVTGFPFAFQVELAKAELRNGAVTPSPVLRIPVLSGNARPWDFANWQLTAPQGLSAELAGAGARPPLTLTAANATGAVSAGAEDGTTVWTSLHGLDLDAGDKVRIASADSWVILPPTPAKAHTDAALEAAFDLRMVRLPATAQALGDTIDEVAFGVTLKGPLPAGKLTEIASAWRDAGGTIELDNLYLKWGGLGATATGTIALDRDLQPMGGFSGAVEGYDQILTALVQNGRMRASDAGLARLALTILAKAGPDGKPQIRTSFTIQGGQMFLGPAKLGPAPRIAWQ